MTGAPQPGLLRWMKGLMLRHMPLMITCAVFEDFILDYLEGQLPERQRRVFGLHLKLCRECREYLAAYRQATALGKAVFSDPSAPLPDEVPEDLIKAVLEARKS